MCSGGAAETHRKMTLGSMGPEEGGRGEMETKLVEVGAGQGSYTKQKDATYGYRPKPHPTLEARPRFEWLVRWGGGAGPRHFAAAGSCAGASKRGLLALLPLWWVCEVRSVFTGETCGRGPEPSRDACLAAPHSPTLMNTVRGVPAVRGQADFCCSQCGVNCYDPITTTEAPRVVVRRHYNTVVRTAQPAMLAATEKDVLPFQFSPTPIGLLIYVAVQKPNAHYECFNGGDYDHEMWSAAHKRWCCYKYKEGCPKQVVDRNIYHHVTKIQKLHVPVPVQIIHNIPQVYHVPSPPKYVHVPVPGPKIHKVTINKDVPYPVKEPPQVITVKKPYTVKVPGHYVDVPVPSPPHIVNKYKYHYVTVHDYDARHRSNGAVRTSTWAAQDCHAGLSNWYHGWSHVKKSWCCVVHTIMGHHAGHGGYDCDAGYSNWEHGWPQPCDYCCGHFQIACAATTLSPLGCDAPCTLHGDTSTCKQRIGWSMEHTFDGKENACGLAYSAVQVECDVCRACTIQEAGCGDQGNAALGNWPWPRCRAWSPEKKVWCCQNEQKGCQNPDTPPDCDAGAGMVWKHLGSRASSHGKVFVSNHWTWQASHGVRFVVGNARAAFGRPLAQLGHGMVGAEEDVVPALPPSVDGHGCCSHEKVGCPGYHYAGAGGGGQTVVTTHTVVSGGGGGSFGGAYSFHGHPPSAAGSGMMWHWVVHTHGNLPFDCFAGITAGWSGGKKHFCCLHFDKGVSCFRVHLQRFVGPLVNIFLSCFMAIGCVMCCFGPRGGMGQMGQPGHYGITAGKARRCLFLWPGGGGGGAGAGGFEEDAEASRTEERWAYVGAGQGTYRQTSQMDYVGHGPSRLRFMHCRSAANSIPPIPVTVVVSTAKSSLPAAATSIRFKEERPDGTVKSVTAEVSGLPFNFFQTGADEMVPAPDPCMTGTVGAMTVMQREACCAQGNVAFCATTTKAPVIIHDKYYTNVRLLGSTHYWYGLQVITTLGMTKGRNAEQKVYVKHHPFECTEGYGSWKTQWSHEHQRYCCYKFKEACVTKVQYRNHYKTITHVHHVTVPEKVVVPAPPPREINHIVKDPSPVIKIKTAGPPRVVKHYVTKKHYVPEPVPSPPTYRYKHVAVPVHVPGKVVHVPVPMPAKTIYKEVPVTKVQHVIQKRYYDCVAGFKNWHFGWSKTKKSWCCSHEQRGCPGTWQGDGLTKTIVTGVTQHIGHGHVHVIHHVHHYTTSSHDVDDLVGDDDASLPPEYRHGDMVVGGGR
ncbi:hypothetical protein AK812_SmicGene24557 [Symbiodinium microadriaticum]|uniref:Uncharacterized protein n=1 Tax=Symbiodinium microadriaticum TaxID=2951 RepID=A0A1Q9DEH5_SYMMI|nr:hypothetical protein AK812_SmicGene24557 [Symbiodinium microadriaticum]